MLRVRRAAHCAIALVLLVAQGSGLLHLVVERHETCPIHGELVEAAAPNAAPVAPTTAIHGPGVSRLPRAHPHGHRPCLAVAFAEDAVTSEPAVGVVAFAALRAPRPVLVVARAPRGPPLFRVAPKTSPPA
jgi:hypothetical protein